jgi:transposase
MDRTHGLPKTWNEGRRKRALELKHHGWKQCAIAAALGVSAAAVSQWVAEARARGSEAWRAKPRPIGPVKLTSDQVQMIPELLSHGAEAYGFRGEFWTCARVATVIWEEFGVSHHKAHVSRLLKRLAWTPQLPIERAAQRDEAVIKQWRVQVWPELKKRRASKGGPLSLWMNRAFIYCQAWSERMRPAGRPPSCGRCSRVIMCRS